MAIYNENIVDIELTSGSVFRSFLNHSIGAGDELANRFGVRVFRNGVAEDIGGTCMGLFIRADGATVTISSGTVDGNVAYVTLPEACYAVEGQFALAIKCQGGGVTGTLRIVDGVVSRTSTSAAVDPGTIIPSVEDLIDAIDEAIEQIPANYNESFAPAYSTSATYAVGQYVTYDGYLWRCTRAITSSESWTGGHWAKVALANDVSELRDELIRPTKNLWKNPEYDNNGVMLTKNNDGSVHIYGTPTQEALFIDYYFDSALPSDNYVLSCRVKGTMTGVKRVMACVRNQSNTGTQFIVITDGINYGEIQLASFAPYRCEIVLLSDTAYDCDLYIQLERGTVSTRYTPPYTTMDYTARNQIEDIAERMENENSLLCNAKNFVDVLEITEKSEVTKWGLGTGVIEHIGNAVHYSLATASNGGFFTEAFSTDSFVLQITRLSFDLAVTSGSVRVWLYGTTKGGTDYANVIGYPVAGHNDISIDFAYYDVYSTLDVSKPIRFLITNGGEEISDFTVSGLIFKSLVTSQNYAEEYKTEKMYSLLDNIAGMIPQIPDQTFIKSPDGNKWLLTISNTGELSATKITPHKSAFIGNSLLMGWVTFGMAASDDDHDYYHHVTQRIHELDNSAQYMHMSNGNLEHSTNSTDFNNAFNAIKQYLTSDLDLICVQLGDNVNTSAKVAQFEGAGGSFDTMVGWIKENCPNTRLIWVGTWYPSIHEWLKSACAANEVEFVDILPLSTVENKAVLGEIVHRTEDREQTLTGTYTTSNGAINAVVTIYGKTYNITIPSYTSVENNGNGTFTMVAPYTVIDSTGVQSHPGDAGMLAIANAILKQIGID